MSCTCPSGSRGTKSCKSDGSGWRACRCRDAATDTGTEPSDGSDGSNGTDGSSDTSQCTNPSQEKCDGKDNDCNGLTDENLVQPCSNQKGVCNGSTGPCRNGSYVSCGPQQYGSNYEKTESSCDGRDNDCDGTVDKNCSCQSGKTQPCGESKGICTQGSQTCKQGSWGPCTGGTQPEPSESCDGQDNDCDGQTDENLTKSCGKSTGVCTKGTKTCSNGSYGSCTGGTGPSSETCDNRDNDCNGKTDENLSRSCGTSTGVCTKGTEYCSAGSWGSCQGNTTPSNETCDGKDNDCDGDTDEGLCNPSFESVSNDGTCDRADAWNFADKSTGYTNDGHICSTTSPVSDGSRSFGISWTGNSNNNKADVWQSAELGGISTIKVDILGPSGGNPQRSKHLILIDGNQVKDCGYVNNGDQETCTVDVSNYSGTREIRHRWKQRSGDNLGNSKIDNVRLIP